MAKNNHFSNNLSELDCLLKEQAADVTDTLGRNVNEFAGCMAAVSNAVVVVSDLARGTSRIFCGAFADELGIKGYSNENSLWEKRILAMMSEAGLEAKIITELRFFHYVRRLGRNRSRYYLMSKLRFTLPDGRGMDILHRMYYVYGHSGQNALYAICIYEPLSVDFKGKSVAVDSLTGCREELDAGTDIRILSGRECQILSLIDSGLKSREIAERLNISTHTVSRHRQEILAKLQVKNSVEACRMARSMQLI